MGLIFLGFLLAVILFVALFFTSTYVDITNQRKEYIVRCVGDKNNDIIDFVLSAIDAKLIEENVLKYDDKEKCLVLNESYNNNLNHDNENVKKDSDYQNNNESSSINEKIVLLKKYYFQYYTNIKFYFKKIRTKDIMNKFAKKQKLDTKEENKNQ